MNSKPSFSSARAVIVPPSSQNAVTGGDEEPDPFPQITPILTLSGTSIHSDTISLNVSRSLSFKPIVAERKIKSSFKTVGPVTEEFRKHYYPEVSDDDWNNWKWQFRNRIRHMEELERFIVLTEDERTVLSGSLGRLPMAITPYYASLVDPLDPSQPLRRTVIPGSMELTMSAGESVDPLNEDGHEVVPGLVHRYPDRVLFLATNLCSVNCRYCTRSRVVGDSECGFSKKDWIRSIEYIKNHPEVRDVLISGGDPLTLTDVSLEYLLRNIRAIPHVEVIRIGTKVPMVLPQRITTSLIKMLKKYHPLWMSIHSTHPDEITPESMEACRRLADAGIPLGSQTVLLKGVNDSTEVLTDLFHKLMRNRVKPYYLYQCDPIAGSSHFRTTVKKGIEIIRGIRGFTSGYAVPHYVIDAPGGGGKIPISPDYIQGSSDGKLILKNYEGNTYEYPDDSLEQEMIK